MTRHRIAVDDPARGVGAVVYVAEPTPAELDAVTDLVDRAADRLRRAGATDPHGALLAAATAAVADRSAYHREAARRGVLAL